MPKCVVMMGIPGSGKTTVVKELFRDMEVHSTDQYIEALARMSGKTYNEMWRQNIKEATRKFKVDVEHSICLDEDFVVDRTNLTEKGRKEILNKLPEHYVKIVCVVGCDHRIAKGRNNLRDSGRRISDEVISEMIGKYEYPTPDEGFDYIVHVTTPGNSLED